MRYHHTLRQILFITHKILKNQYLKAIIITNNNKTTCVSTMDHPKLYTLSDKIDESIDGDNIELHQHLETKIRIEQTFYKYGYIPRRRIVNKWSKEDIEVTYTKDNISVYMMVKGRLISFDIDLTNNTIDIGANSLCEFTKQNKKDLANYIAILLIKLQRQNKITRSRSLQVRSLVESILPEIVTAYKTNSRKKNLVTNNNKKY